MFQTEAPANRGCQRPTFPLPAAKVHLMSQGDLYFPNIPVLCEPSVYIPAFFGIMGLVLESLLSGFLMDSGKVV